MREKRRPSLEELKALPSEMWELEVHQMAVDFPTGQKLPDWFLDVQIYDGLTPEKVIEIRNRLFGASGSTEQAA